MPRRVGGFGMHKLNFAFRICIGVFALEIDKQAMN